MPDRRAPSKSAREVASRSERRHCARYRLVLRQRSVSTSALRACYEGSFPDGLDGRRSAPDNPSGGSRGSLGPRHESKPCTLLVRAPC
jgi:hypothetical protein